jgi:mRNA interferase HicA
MKLIDFERHLKKYFCQKIREGGNHSIYKNMNNGKTAPLPRHREIKHLLIKKICDQLDIPSPFN